MRIIEQFYGDFVVTDEMPFDLESIRIAASKILVIEGVAVFSWPVTIEHDEATNRWELWFLRPVNDKEYEKVPEVPAKLSSNDAVLA